MDDLFSLSGRLVLVTGGTRGIGRAISLDAARAGARVIANYCRNDATAESLADEARSRELDIELCRGDLTSKKGLEAVTDAVGAALDASSDLVLSLVHCAATGVHKPANELTPRHFDWTFALNVKAYFELVKTLLPRFAKGSAIVPISSEGAVHAVQAYSFVGASKGALESLSRHLAAELAPRGVRVNVLSPGSVPTEAWDVFPEKDARLEKAISRTPRGVLTTPEEVASVARFLLSDASAAIVGQTIVVDGGKRIVE